MRLDPGQSTGEHAESHDKSEQLLLLLEGRLMADIGGRNLVMNIGDVVIIPPRVKHKFTNPGDTSAVNFNVYCPPEYPPTKRDSGASESTRPASSLALEPDYRSFAFL
jgi:mannose-6-phosphate isomerase-like protein (cupin superfamily)